VKGFAGIVPCCLLYLSSDAETYLHRESVFAGWRDPSHPLDEAPLTNEKSFKMRIIWDIRRSETAALLWQHFDSLPLLK
jgi:hypothetical protein